MTNQTTGQIAGKTVARVGFGAMQLPGPGVLGPPKDHDEAIAVLRRAVDAGVNHIDTAEFGGFNRSTQHRFVGARLTARREPRPGSSSRASFVACC